MSKNIPDFFCRNAPVALNRNKNYISSGVIAARIREDFFFFSSTLYFSVFDWTRLFSNKTRILFSTNHLHIIGLANVEKCKIYSKSLYT